MALRYAEAVALRSGAALTVVYVNDPLLVAAAAAALHNRRLVKESAKELREFADATLAAATRSSLQVKYHASVGDPSDEIMKAAGRARSDLIVLGTHGLTGADRLLLGSTTLSVLQRTAVPVLAVPRAGPSPTAGPLPSWPAQRIVAPIELDGDTAREVESAARMAKWFGASLLLLHVIDQVAAPAWLKGDLTPHDRIRIARAQQHLDGFAAAARRIVTTDTRVVSGRPADEIAALAATERTELLITALRDRRGWFGTRRGAVSYHVLSHAVTPVLAFPTKWRPR
jgi:nucleotide-binding universal stress UspA family protein